MGNRILIVKLRKGALYRKKYAPTHLQADGCVQYGGDIKTGVSFRENITKIIDLSTKRNQELILPTFAYYENSINDSADGPDMEFTKIWGSYENVIRGIDVHNSIIRDLAKNHNFIFIDMENLMSNEKKFFKDICHFTDEGSRFYANNILESLKYVKVQLPEALPID